MYTSKISSTLCTFFWVIVRFAVLPIQAHALSSAPKTPASLVITSSNDTIALENTPSPVSGPHPFIECPLSPPPFSIDCPLIRDCQRIFLSLFPHPRPSPPEPSRPSPTSTRPPGTSPTPTDSNRHFPTFFMGTVPFLRDVSDENGNQSGAAANGEVITVKAPRGAGSIYQLPQRYTFGSCQAYLTILQPGQRSEQARWEDITAEAKRLVSGRGYEVRVPDESRASRGKVFCGGKIKLGVHHRLLLEVGRL